MHGVTWVVVLSKDIASYSNNLIPNERASGKRLWRKNNMQACIYSNVWLVISVQNNHRPPFCGRQAAKCFIITFAEYTFQQYLPSYNAVWRLLSNASYIFKLCTLTRWRRHALTTVILTTLLRKIMIVHTLWCALLTDKYICRTMCCFLFLITHLRVKPPKLMSLLKTCTAKFPVGRRDCS